MLYRDKKNIKFETDKILSVPRNEYLFLTSPPVKSGMTLYDVIICIDLNYSLYRSESCIVNCCMPLSTNTIQLHFTCKLELHRNN